MKLLRFLILLVGLCGSLAFGDFLAISPDTTPGGSKPYPVLTVTLPSAAPAGGTVVHLTTSNSAVAKVPSSLTVPEGSATATANVTTFAVAADSDATITGTSGSLSGSATVHVLAARLQSLTVNTTSLHGGTTSKFVFKATLTGKAPAGGAIIAIQSNSANLPVPSSITIGAGNFSATFQAFPAAVAANEAVRVSASYRGDTKTSDVNILAPSVVGITPSPQTVYGGSGVGSTVTVKLNSPAPSGGLDLPLTNDHPATLTVPASMHIDGDQVSGTFTALAPNAVNAKVAAKVSATYGTTKTTNIFVQAAQVATMTLSPASVTGSQNSTATITLTGPAGSTGVTVSLTSANSTLAYFVAPSIWVPAGQTTGTMKVITNPVDSATSVTLSATAGTTASATLTIVPPVLDTFTLNASTVTGGSSTSVTGTLRLTGHTGSSGFVVNLSSSDPSAVTVPATVTVPAGPITVSFGIQHHYVSSDKTVTLTAVGSTTRTATLIVKAPVFKELTLDHAFVTGGSSTAVFGTVTLDAPAGSGGKTVTLSSSNTSVATVPATVTVPEGQTQMGFAVEHYAVDSTWAVTITATLGSVTKKATMEVQPKNLARTWRKFHADSRNTGRGAASNATGVLLWKYNVGSDGSSPTLGADGTLYVGSGYGYLYALNSATGALKWRYLTGNEVKSSAAIGPDGSIYFGSNDHKYYSLDGATGAFRWSASLGTATCDSSPTLGSGGKVYAASTDGALHCWDGATGNQLFSVPFGQQCVRSCAAIGAGGTVYADVGSFLYSINGTTGAINWKYLFDLGNLDLSSPVIGDDGTIYVGGIGGNPVGVYAINSNGTLKWSYDTAGQVASTPAIGTDGSIYITSMLAVPPGGYLYCLDGSTGTLKWKFKAGGPISSSPAIGDDGKVYFGSYDHFLYAINAATGTLIWKYGTGNEIASSPCIGPDGTIYIGSQDGWLYAIH